MQNLYCNLYSKIKFILIMQFPVLILSIQLMAQENFLNDPLQSFSESPDFLKSLSTLESLRTLNDNDIIYNVNSEKNNNVVDSSQIVNEKNFNKTLSKNKLEKEFSNRSGANLLIQGFELFENSFNENKITNFGTDNDNYIVGPKDQLKIVLQGEVNKILNIQVDSSGMLILPFTSPIIATGKKLSELKNEIIKKVSISYVETEAYISLSRVKNFSVIVSGEVNRPGIYQLNGFSSIVDAIIVAGGIKKEGSLRNIKVISKNKTINIDLYNLIFGLSESKKLRSFLNEGSIITVPTMGHAVAITGDVRKPGIYELKSKSENVNDLLKISGGHLMPQSQNISMQRINKNGESLFLGKISSDLNLQNGDLIFATPIPYQTNGYIKVSGAVNVPSFYALDEYKKLSKIINKKGLLKSNAYKYAAIIKNTSKFGDIKYKTINIHRIIRGDEDLILNDLDEILILDWQDMQFLNSVNILQAMRNVNHEREFCKSTQAFSKNFRSLGSEGRNYFYSFINALEDLKVEDFQNNRNFDHSSGDSTEEKKSLFCPSIYDNNPNLLFNVIKNSIIIRGVVEKPGVYLVAKNTISDMFNNFISNDYKFNFSPDKKIIDVYEPTVTIHGSVKYPVKVSVNTTPMLSNHLDNIDSLDENAYPYFGFIKRKNTLGENKNLLVFNPLNIIYKHNDIKLAAGDEIYIPSIKEVNNFKLLYKTYLDKKSTTNAFNSDNTSNYDNKLSMNSSDNKSFNDYNTMKIPNAIKQPLNKLEEFEQTNPLGVKKISALNEKNITPKNKNTLEEKIEINSDNLFFNLLKNNLINIQGEVISPGFYPLGGKIRTSKAINIAGGFTNESLKSNIEVNNIEEINDGYVYPSAKIFVPSLNSNKKEISLVGSLDVTRKIMFKKGLSLLDLQLSKNEFNLNTNMNFGTVKRISNYSGNHSFLAFSPAKVLKNKQNIILKEGDIIKFYTLNETDNLIKKFTDSKESQTPDFEIVNFPNMPSEAGTIEELVRRLIIRVEGEVSKPGQYLLGGYFNLEEVIKISGGLKNSAKENEIIVTTPSKDNMNNVSIKETLYDLTKTASSEVGIIPGSLIRVPITKSELSLGFAEITGQVIQSGSYRIIKGDTLFSLIKRSGGLLDNAYLDGMIFMREEEKAREQKSIKRLTRELDKAISIALEQQDNENDINAASLESLRELSLASSSFESVGRIVGNFKNIDILKNTKIVSGDKIFIPSKPTSITIVGEIMTPGSILWEQGKNVNSYIKSSAGFTALAEKSRVFVIYPNGKAEKVSRLWSNTKTYIYPGSTIVVPRRIELSSTLGKIRAVTEVVYQLTLTIAGIDNLLTN